ncbi:gametocyte-specific factor 1-like [Natator depressus]|uniref:gametocyte-specific factor 1-like n=1 Tax=Natator depressus TaxID=27790 RepID=UPI003EC05647
MACIGRYTARLQVVLEKVAFELEDLEESDTQRLAQSVLQQSFSSFSISQMDLEGNYVDALDPERLIQCPYDNDHQIRACRFPYHLIKCRKNHPEIAKQLATCPFNARHQVPRAEISHHISSCDDKSCIEEDIVSHSNNCQGEKMNIVSMWQPPPCDEDWDRDLQEQSNSTFVWGTFSSDVNNSPGSSVIMEQKNNLTSGMRAPKSLPYSLSWKSSKYNGWWSPHAQVEMESSVTQSSLEAAAFL